MPNSVAYLREAGGPGELEKHVSDIQGSGLTTVILIGLHLGYAKDPLMNAPDPTMKFGDFIYNDYPLNLIVRDGTFNPKNPDPDRNAAIAKWPAQVAQLKQQGSVSSVFLAVGGPKPYWADFTTIQQMFAAGNAEALKKNIVALREAFTLDGVCAIDGIDIDCEEEEISQDTIVRFCEMVFELGFKVTFCPFESEAWWKGCMKTLWDKGYKVSWWNLQCYSSGGKRNLNRLSQWIAALGAVVGPQAASAYLVPGLAVAGEGDVKADERHCPLGPDSFETIVAGWRDRKLGGAFLWRYDCVAENPDLCGKQNNLANYVKAINQGLNG